MASNVGGAQQTGPERHARGGWYQIIAAMVSIMQALCASNTVRMEGSDGQPVRSCADNQETGICLLDQPSHWDVIDANNNGVR
jgi:hypothetical protein